MLYEIVFSPTGGTQKASNALVQGIGKESKFIDLSDNKENINIVFDEKDICVFAVPSYGGRVPAYAVEKIEKISGKSTKAVIMAVYGNREFEDTLVELEDILKKSGFEIVAGVSAIAEHSIIREFGAERPDNQDINKLIEIGKTIIEKIESGKASNPEIPGNRPYKVYNPLPIGINVNENCNGCGICAEKCPVQVIDKNNPSKGNEEGCISCMRCISVCPQNARSINPQKREFLKEKIKEACKERKECKLFI